MAEEIMYEIGLCPAATGPATILIGPFPDKDSCLTYWNQLPNSPKGMAYLWGRIGEMTAAPNCVRETPNTGELAAEAVLVLTKALASAGVSIREQDQANGPNRAVTYKIDGELVAIYRTAARELLVPDGKPKTGLTVDMIRAHCTLYRSIF